MKKSKIRSGGIFSFMVCTAFLLLQPWEQTIGNSSIPVNTTLVKSTSTTIQQEQALNTAITTKDTTETKAASENGKATSKADAKKSSCRKEGCNVYAEIDKSEQVMYVYVSGELQNTYPVSTGKAGHETPNLDLRPAGPLYRSYTSTKYPEGDYQGMGNMPYAVFLRGGYAIHGTTKGSISKLGNKASHGCVRLHPEDAREFFELVKSIGLENTWVTIHP